MATERRTLGLVRTRFGGLATALTLLAGCVQPRPVPAPEPAAAPTIVERPIPFSPARVEMTREYIRSHYGLDVADIEIVPRIIVLHWTAVPSLSGSFNAFAPEALPGGRPELRGAGEVNVSAQFLIDRDGTVYRLMPENWMARHVIGLNYDAIGIENVGGTDGREDLTEAQIQANVALVRHLTREYPTIQYLIAHSEYRAFEGHPLWRELDSGYRTEKIDPGPRFMSAVRSRLAPLGLKGVPEITREKRAP